MVKTYRIVLMLAALLMLPVACGRHDKKADTPDSSKQTSQQQPVVEPVYQEMTVVEPDSVPAVDDVPALASDGKILVMDFYATWCGPCKELSPYMEKWAHTYANDVTFMKIDIDQEQQLAEEYQINAVPTVMIFAPNGQLLYRREGLDPDGIQNYIEFAISQFR